MSEYEAALPAGGWPNWELGNHDRPRVASRVGPDQARIAAMLLLTLRGTPTIYYGDEIAMNQVAIAPDQVRDPLGENIPGQGALRQSTAFGLYTFRYTRFMRGRLRLRRRKGAGLRRPAHASIFHPVRYALRSLSFAAMALSLLAPARRISSMSLYSITSSGASGRQLRRARGSRTRSAA